MHWLTALAAFAATMFMLSIIVSVMTEMWHRLRRSRLRGLRMMLERLYEHSIEPRLVIKKPGTHDELDAPEFARLIIDNRAAAAASGEVSEPGRLNELEHISEEIFAQKLADLKPTLRPAPTGQTTATDIEPVIKDVVAKFVSFGSEMSVAFERNARVVSIVSAFILAFLAYVHPYQIAKVYLTNEDLAKKVAETGTSLEADLAEIKETSETLSKQGQLDQMALDRLKALDGMVASIDAKLDTIKAEGVPIGWPDTSVKCEQWPFHLENCQWQMGSIKLSLPSPINTFWLAFGALLVGLGGPFWKQIIDAATRSNAVTQKLSSIVGGISAATQQGESETSTSLKTFTTATDAGAVKELKLKGTTS